MKCICGNENPNGAKYCNQCGKQIFIETKQEKLNEEKNEIDNLKVQNLNKNSFLLFGGVGLIVIGLFFVLYILPCQNLRVKAEKAYSENKFKDAKMFLNLLNEKDQLDIYSKYDNQSDLDKQIYYQEAYEVAKNEIQDEGSIITAMSAIDGIKEDYILFNDKLMVEKQLEKIILERIEKVSSKISDLSDQELKEEIIVLSSVSKVNFPADEIKEKADGLKIQLFDTLGELGLEKCKHKKYDEAADIFEIFISENQEEHTAYRAYSKIMEKNLAADMEVKKREEKIRVAKEKATKEKAAKELAKKKKMEGVNIGMTKEDVLASSWGKPNEINRTINQYGTREQWCYGNGNYLYFDDGILTSIQN